MASNAATSKHIVINLGTTATKRGVLDHVVRQMVLRGYSEREIWQVWAACRDAEDVDELCGWLSTFLPIRVRQTLSA
jgi:hypothetical protein